MELNLTNYAGAPRKESKQYAWYLNDMQLEALNRVAGEHKVAPSVILRYIMDWGCNMMEGDERFRNYVLDHYLEVKGIIDNKQDKKRMNYMMSKEVSEKLEFIRRKYRFYNINVFVPEVMDLFFDAAENPGLYESKLSGNH